MEQVYSYFRPALSGMSWQLRGSLVLLHLKVLQIAHFNTTSSICFAMLGQNMTSLAFSLHLTIPRWDSCTLANMSALKLCGTIIRQLLKSNPSEQVSSSRKVQYFLMSAGIYHMSAGHPDWTTSMTICNSSSSAVAVLNVVSFSFEIGKQTDKEWTCNSSSRSGSVCSFR